MPSHKEFYDAISNISVNADTLNLNTDQVETKLDTVNGLLTTLSADTAIIKTDMADGVTINQPVSVSASSLPLPSGAATSANQTTANTSLSNIDSDLGATSDSAATTDTGTFSLIGLFKRLLSRITTLVPANLTVTSTRLLVDGSGVTQPVSGTFWQATQPISGTITANAGTGTYTTSDRGSTGESTVSGFTSTTSATLKSSNSNRKVLTIYNEGTGNLHVLYGSGTASTTNYSVKLFSGDYLEVDKYTGQVNAIFASAGTARVTEIT